MAALARSLSSAFFLFFFFSTVFFPRDFDRKLCFKLEIRRKKIDSIRIPTGKNLRLRGRKREREKERDLLIRQSRAQPLGGGGEVTILLFFFAGEQ